MGNIIGGFNPAQIVDGWYRECIYGEGKTNTVVDHIPEYIIIKDKTIISSNDVTNPYSPKVMDNYERGEWKPGN